NFVDHFHSFNDASEYCVIGWKRIGLMHYEELTRSSFRNALVRHRDQSAPIASLIQWRASVDLVRQRLTRCCHATSSVASRVTSLNHEPADHAMKDSAVVKASLRKESKILRGLWSLVLKQLKLNCAEVGFNY